VRSRGVTMSKTKDSTASSAILEYLNKQNRPYSATDILNNLHKEHGKTAVVKALDSLAAEGKIRSKTYNKQTVYVADQSQLPCVDEAEIQSMEKKTVEVSACLKQSLEECKQLESELAALTSSLTTDEAKKELIKLSAECEQMVQRLHGLKNHVNAVSPAERTAIVKAHTLYVSEWRKRKRLCNEIVNAILEGYPKSKKELLEEVGIETDEDVGAKLPGT